MSPVAAPAGVDLPRRAWVEQIMGLPVSIHVRGPHARAERAEVAVRAAFDLLGRADAVFSTYRGDSALSRLERGELPLAGVPRELVEVIDLCEQARRDTGGAFDARLPDRAGGRRFDPTGLVKGWAVGRAHDRLDVLHGHDTLIDAGGDVVGRCRVPGGPAWRVGVEDPADRTRLLTVLALRDGAVATSGTAARGAHVVDPRTGDPATALRSVTVAGPALLWADVHATAALGRGADALGYLRALPGHGWLVADAAGRTFAGGGLGTAGRRRPRPPRRP